jgi:hypothetical protein
LDGRESMADGPVVAEALARRARTALGGEAGGGAGEIPGRSPLALWRIARITRQEEHGNGQSGDAYVDYVDYVETKFCQNAFRRRSPSFRRRSRRSYGGQDGGQVRSRVLGKKFQLQKFSAPQGAAG